MAIPALAGQAARVTAWQGTLADDVHEIEAGWPTPEFVAEMKERSRREPFPAPALLAIGRWHKRQGDLAEARRWYDAALEADPRSAEAQVNLGNVLFLEGDLEGAKAAYLAAVERASDLSTLAAAQYDLSKLYLRLASVGQSSEARRKAQQADAAYLARHGSDDDFRANAWLVDALPSAERLAELAARDAGPRAVGEAALRRVAGPLARWGWPLLPLGLVASLWVFALARPAARPGGALRPVRPARLPALRPRGDGQLRTVRERLLAPERRRPARPQPQGGPGPAPRPGPALDRAGPGRRRRRRGSRGGRAPRCSDSWWSSRSSSWGSWPGSGTGWSRLPSTPRTRWRCASPWPFPSSCSSTRSRSATPSAGRGED